MASSYAKFILAALVAALACYALTELDANAMRTLAATLASIAATMVGFVLAAVSILWSSRDRTLISNMQKTGHYTELVNELYQSVIFFVGSLIFCLIVLFLPDAAVFIPTAIGTVLFVFGGSLFISSGRKFCLVLHYLK